NLTVKAGEIVALIGPNGAGKSTLIRAISGVIVARAGEICFRGKNLRQFPNRLRAQILGIVPQARQLGGAFTVAQTVMLGRTAYMGWLGRARAADEAAVRWALQKTALETFAQRLNAELSGGEQQRVLLARALAAQTPVLLLDEPTNHLDLKHQLRLLTLVRKLAKKENLAVLMAMHDLNQVSAYADRVALLKQGRLVACGTTHEVLTSQNISAAYETRIEVIAHPINGTLLIFPANK
ncbi:MAG: ABC transporter ATP-binding protein, partial [Anaerolineales bacterium]|nr:ABC transporter ATP-binding protein [Anaerolineales bacterium]